MTLMNQQNATTDSWPDSATFWRDKVAVVTGGAGFLGSFVVEKLRQRGVAGLVVPRSRVYNLTQVDAVRQLYADALAQFRIDPAQVIVIHLAARVGGIGVNRLRPADFFYDNLMMGAHLMHEAWSTGLGKFVAIGTICAYPKHTPVPFHEESLWDGYPEETNAPYGLAKKMLLVQSQAYRQQYGFNSTFLLPVNLYGPRDNFDLETSHVIPALIHKCAEASDSGVDHIVAWGDGSPTREFLYVEDAAEGVILSAERLNSSEPVNLGSAMEISIRDLVTTIARLTGFQGDIIWDVTKPNGQPRRRLDTSRAWELFGFRAQTNFDEGLERTIAWYRQQSGETVESL